MTEKNIIELKENWFNALISYGTPIDFFKSTKINLLYSKSKNKIPIRRAIVDSYKERFKLLEYQEDIRKKRIESNLIQRWENDSSECYLCDNIGQAKKLGNNLIFPFETFKNQVIIPNRYPAINFHLLACSKNHNDINQNLNITKKFLEEIIETAKKYDLLAIRNHPYAGMSIKDHEHLHLFPRKYNNSKESFYINGLFDSNNKEFNDSKKINFIEQSEFATISIPDNKVEKFIDIIFKLNEEKIIFTFIYDPISINKNICGKFFLTPHIKESFNDRSISSMSQIYFYSSEDEDNLSYEEIINKFKNYIYPKGEFNWEKYF